MRPPRPLRRALVAVALCAGLCASGSAAGATAASSGTHVRGSYAAGPAGVDVWALGSHPGVVSPTPSPSASDTGDRLGLTGAPSSAPLVGLSLVVAAGALVAVTLAAHRVRRGSRPSSLWH